MTWWAAVGRLASILAGVGLVVTRLGLLLHELVGHGVTAIACGGRVTDVQLFWFAGGWIRYDLPALSPAERIAIATGGIAVELVLGAALWFGLARSERFGVRLVRAAAGATIIHGAWYLAVGTWHGFGDGEVVRRNTGDAHYAIAIAGAVVVCGFAFVVARAILRVLVATIPGGRAARLGGFALAVVVAGGLQVGLAVGEVAVRHDATYGAIMERERDRVIAGELARWEAEQARRGATIDPAARRQRVRALADEHRELPFGVIVGVCALLASAAGAWRARAAVTPVVATRSIVLIGLAACGSIALVIAIDAAFV